MPARSLLAVSTKSEHLQEIVSYPLMSLEFYKFLGRDKCTQSVDSWSSWFSILSRVEAFNKLRAESRMTRALNQLQCSPRILAVLILLTFKFAI